MTRNEVIRKMRAAKTFEKVEEGQAAVTAWLEEHPDGLHIISEAEGLEIMGSALRELEGRKDR